MTDRFNSLTVVLEDATREDDAEALISAIKQFRGVLTVSGNVTDPMEYIAIARAKREMLGKLLSEVGVL